MTIYNDILDQAGGDTRVAGDLHERLWEYILRLDEPRFHNVRVTRGDGGLDGFVLTDPILGYATVYQAKFFLDVTSDEHRKSIVDSFVKAHSHSFHTKEWVLLLPSSISHGDLDWIVGGGLRQAAKAKLSDDRHARIRDCAITYRLASHLEEALARHLEVACEFLPQSSPALTKKVLDIQAAADRLQLEIADRLEVLINDSIRRRQFESLMALRAVHRLYFGWADYIGLLDAALRVGPVPVEMERLSIEIESDASSRASLALVAEGLASGASEDITNIYVSARRLRQAAIMTSISAEHASYLKQEVAGLLAQIRAFARKMGDIHMRYEQSP